MGNRQPGYGNVRGNGFGKAAEQGARPGQGQQKLVGKQSETFAGTEDDLVNGATNGATMESSRKVDTPGLLGHGANPAENLPLNNNGVLNSIGHQLRDHSNAGEDVGTVHAKKATSGATDSELGGDEGLLRDISVMLENLTKLTHGQDHAESGTENQDKQHDVSKVVDEAGKLNAQATNVTITSLPNEKLEDATKATLGQGNGQKAGVGNYAVENPRSHSSVPAEGEMEPPVEVDTPVNKSDPSGHTALLEDTFHQLNGPGDRSPSVCK